MIRDQTNEGVKMENQELLVDIKVRAIRGLIKEYGEEVACEFLINAIVDWDLEDRQNMRITVMEALAGSGEGNQINAEATRIAAGIAFDDMEESDHAAHIRDALRDNWEMM